MECSRWIVMRWAVTTVVLVLTASPLFAVLRVSPAVVEGQFQNGRISGSFTITSSDAKSLRLRVFPVHFRLSVDGQVVHVPVDSTSLADWIKITPREFTLEPNSERQVRYAVIVPDSMPERTYWGAVEFLPLPTHQDSIDAQTQLKAIAVVLVPIMVDKGRPSYSWNLNPDSMRSVVTPNGVVVTAKVSNDGNGRIPQKGRFEIRDASGNVVNSGETERLSVLPHSERYLKTNVPKTLSAGTYDYVVTYTSEVDGSQLTGALRFDVPETYPESKQKKR